jgi:multicomponent Na+:H+ antiporter subunit G
MLVDVLSAALLLGGVSFSLLAAVGLQRFDDVFARIHAATKATTLGLVLVLVAVALQIETKGDIAKLGLVAILQFMTAPVSAQMVGRAAYRAGTELSPTTVLDQLSEARLSQQADDVGGDPG